MAGIFVPKVEKPNFKAGPKRGLPQTKATEFKKIKRADIHKGSKP